MRCHGDGVAVRSEIVEVSDGADVGEGVGVHDRFADSRRRQPQMSACCDDFEPRDGH